MATAPKPLKADPPAQGNGGSRAPTEPPSSRPTHPAQPTQPSEPTQTDSIEEQTLAIVRELLVELGSQRAADSLSLHSSFERDLGLGSLERVELLVRCEARFKTRLPDEVAQQAETPGEWVRALSSGAGLEAAARPRYQITQPTRDAPPAPESASTWVEVLRRHAEVEPNRVQAHLLEEGGGQDITYGRLLETSSRVAAGLRQRGLQRDDTVAIMLPTSADFFFAFFGVMLAGGIPVPIYPPARPDKIEEYVRRQVGILRNAEVRFLISFDQVRVVARIMRLSIPSLIDMTTVDALSQSGTGASPARLERDAEPSQTAFIQYTSGSTGDPKGVVLSQANVLANVRGIGWAVKFRPTDIVVSWLPLYHDMGLIGSWLFSVYFGAPITVLSPLAFLSRPERWLWAMHDSSGTLCPAPNFSFELCARKIPDSAIEGLDLSAWRVAINAGEAVLPETLARFAERFAPYGFRPESYVPCYGLAESSVALTFPPIDRRPVIDVIRRDLFEAEGRAVPAPPDESGVLRFVANGMPLPGHEVKMVDDQGREVEERVQGRLFFRGLSRTSGYYRNPQATEAVLDQDGWMNSGDLAYRAGGELYVTGRVKDLIIKGGRNLIPQEVEAAAADVPGVRRGCVAAFGTVDRETGTERLVVVAETRALASEERRRIEAEIVSRVDSLVGLPPDKVVLVGPQSIPKTSSGKIRRVEVRRLYEGAGFEAGKRPPWLQIARLGLENLASWLRRNLDRLSAAAGRAYDATLMAAVGVPAGVLARIAPGSPSRMRVVQGAARLLVSLSGARASLAHASGEGSLAPTAGRAAVLVANRAGRFDPLVLVAALPLRFLIAEPLSGPELPWPVAFLLRPLRLKPVYGEAAPRGGTIGQRVRQALENGQSVLVLPEGPAGLPPHLSRFRLDVFRAAVETSTPIFPIGVRGTAAVLAGKGAPPRGAAKEVAGAVVSPGSGSGPRIRVGPPLEVPASGDHQGAVELRDRVRQAIAAAA